VKPNLDIIRERRYMAIAFFRLGHNSRRFCLVWIPSIELLFDRYDPTPNNIETSGSIVLYGRRRQVFEEPWQILWRKPQIYKSNGI
jgi:hypothetical protein